MAKRNKHTAVASEADKQRRTAAGGAGPLVEVEDVREQLTAAAAGAGSPLGPVSRQLGCAYSADADRLWLAAGTAAGAVALFPVAEPRAGSSDRTFGAPSAVLAGGHTDVRSPPTSRCPARPTCMLAWNCVHCFVRAGCMLLSAQAALSLCGLAARVGSTAFKRSAYLQPGDPAGCKSHRAAAGGACGAVAGHERLHIHYWGRGRVRVPVEGRSEERPHSRAARQETPWAGQAAEGCVVKDLRLPGLQRPLKPWRRPCRGLPWAARCKALHFHTMLASKASRLHAFAAPSLRWKAAPFGALSARRPLRPLSLRNLNRASLLATVLLPLLTVSMASVAANSAAGACPDSSAPIPANIQAAADDILQAGCLLQWL